MNSDFFASAHFIKNKMKKLLLSEQALGDEIEYGTEKIIWINRLITNPRHAKF